MSKNKNVIDFPQQRVKLGLARLKVSASNSVATILRCLQEENT